jgi:hypothetical protein
MDAPMTKEVFHKHLSQEPHHNEYCESGDTLMSKLADQKILKTRGSTHGFVIPKLDCKTRNGVMRFLSQRQCSVQINFCAKINDGEVSYPYVHIKLSKH